MGKRYCPSGAGDYSSRVGSLQELASYDVSAAYEVDMGGLYYDEQGEEGKKFCFITASGCSCWDGSYDESNYATLDELITAMRADESHYHGPSLKTRDEMEIVARARAAQLGIV